MSSICCHYSRSVCCIVLLFVVYDSCLSISWGFLKIPQNANNILTLLSSDNSCQKLIFPTKHSIIFLNEIHNLKMPYYVLITKSCVPPFLLVM